MLNDVQYAIRQLRKSRVWPASTMCQDAVQRALDALERVEAELERIEAEVDEECGSIFAEPDTSSFTTCEECARSWGPHYSGPCDH